jgi:hypothetical protein
VKAASSEFNPLSIAPPAGSQSYESVETFHIQTITLTVQIYLLFYKPLASIHHPLLIFQVRRWANFLAESIQKKAKMVW